MPDVQHEPRLPRLARRILRLTVPEYDREAVCHEFETRYRRRRNEDGPTAARRWLWAQVLCSIPGLFRAGLGWSLALLRSNARIAFRHIVRQKVFSIINIAGLTAGMTGFLLLAVNAGTKLHADGFHRDIDRMYSVVQVVADGDKGLRHTALVPPAMGPALREEFPDLEAVVRVIPNEQCVLRRDDGMNFFQRGLLFVDPEFFDLFSFRLAAGNPATALTEPNRLLLTEAMARKYFGDEDPLGRVLRMDDRISLTVAGVVKDLPRTSSLNFLGLISLRTLRALDKAPDTDWRGAGAGVFVRLSESGDPSLMKERLTGLLQRHLGQDAPREAYLLPFADFRLDARHVESFLHQGNRLITVILLVVSCLLLLVVCVNFVNLSVARYMGRIQEIGLRKVLGARRGQVVRQFLVESVLLALLAVPLTIITYEIVEPWFAFGQSIPTTVSNSLGNYPFMLGYLVVVALLTGLAAGLYPALVATRARPVDILRGSNGLSHRNRLARTLIVAQFSLSILFILTALVVDRQMEIFLKSDFGFDRAGVLVVETDGVPPERTEILQRELGQLPEVAAISASAESPVIWDAYGPIRPEGVAADQTQRAEIYPVDYGFPEVMGIALEDGRSFERDRADGDAVIINRALAERLGLSNLLGRTLMLGERTVRVIGVSRNFVLGDVGFEMPPAVLVLDGSRKGCLLLRPAPGITPADLKARLTADWNRLLPDHPLSAYTVVERFQDLMWPVVYAVDLLRFLGLVAVFFSLLGLFGLAAYMVERRTKEIGIRKVLGASVAQVTWRLVRQYLIMVGIACGLTMSLVALAWDRVMATGLLYFEPIGWELFVVTGMSVMLLAVMAAGSRAWRAARANPLDSLRYE
ncbi:MAG: ABC transporter permease [Acidobacteria bacterium]|nr:ABC transporter permease [Acidobacteriota bacterium]